MCRGCLACRRQRQEKARRLATPGFESGTGNRSSLAALVGIFDRRLRAHEAGEVHRQRVEELAAVPQMHRADAGAIFCRHQDAARAGQANMATLSHVTPRCSLHQKRQATPGGESW